jgi:hypothetical protein
MANVLTAGPKRNSRYFDIDCRPGNANAALSRRPAVHSPGLKASRAVVLSEDVAPPGQKAQNRSPKGATNAAREGL